jgi:hypothetical protein
MISKKSFLYLAFVFYATAMSYLFGLIVGVYISLLTCSFFMLLTPLVAYVAMFSALFSRGNSLRILQRWMLGVWILLLILNIITLVFFPIVYTKTALTMFLYHMFLVPMAGGVPIAVTGFAALYSWLVAEYTESWLRLLLCVLGALASSFAFHFFMKGFYFAQFIASLNSTTINY